jgi:nitroreductase
MTAVIEKQHCFLLLYAKLYTVFLLSNRESKMVVNNLTHKKFGMEKELINEPLPATATLKTIYQRRAVRKYQDKQVDKKLIEQVLDAGRMAPSAMNTQSWKFYVFTNKENIHLMSKEIKKVAAKDFLKSGLKQIIKMAASLFHMGSSGIDFFKTEDPVFYGAPVVIFITAPKDNEWAGLDIGMYAQNMMLAATSLGLDSCPVGFGKYLGHTKSYALLQAKASEQLYLSIILGYGSGIPAVHKRKTNNIFFMD